MLRRRNEGRAMLCALLAPAFLACGASSPPPAASGGGAPPDPENDPATATQSPWEACYGTFAPSGDARADLARLVRECGGLGGMQPLTAVRTGEQSELDPVDRYTFEVTAAGSCYRVYAVADGTVLDLDLLLRGPAGDAAVADVTHDAFPVLPPREPVCFAAPGLYQLEVSVYRGAGQYALQVWGR